MMPVPTPPTDNIYKFVAICFVVLLVGSFWMGVWELKNVAEARFADQRSVDEQTTKLEMWALEASGDEAKSVRNDYVAKRSAKLLETSANRQKQYELTVVKIGSWWGNTAGVFFLFAVLGIGVWYLRVQVIHDELQRLERRLLIAKVLRAEYENRTTLEKE